MKIHIRVTKKDVKEGKQGNCKSCPVALAASRRFKRIMYASVASIACPNLPGNNTIRLPNSVTLLIRHFDRTKEMPIFGFSVELTNEQEELYEFR